MTKRYRVLITDLVCGSLDAETRILGDLADVAALSAQHEAELFGRVEEADALMVYHTIKITRATIDRLQHCKLIVRCGVGYDNVDGAAARARGIPLANVPDYGTEEVADSALGLLLALTRGIVRGNTVLRPADANWTYEQVAPLPRLRGRTLGIVGLGRIGTAMAQRGRALGMDVLFFDPYKSDGYDKAQGVRRVETLEELLRQSYVVSLHCPLTNETRNLINADTLEHMQHGSYLVNTARGGVVNTAAIPDAIASGLLAGAGIDVLPVEPPADDDALVRAWRDPQHPAHHRVILNAHQAFYSIEGLLEMHTKGAEACRRALLGQPLRNVVN